jgi:hypothetical protein
MRKTLLIFAVLGLAGSLRAADPIIGTWKPNIAQSKPIPGESLSEGEIDVFRELDTNEIECVAKKPDGSVALRVTYPKQGGIAKLLQPSVPETISYVATLIEPGNWYITFMMNGIQIRLLHRIVRKDGKTMRTTITGIDANGKPFEAIYVADRQ